MQPATVKCTVKLFVLFKQQAWPSGPEYLDRTSASATYAAMTLQPAVVVVAEDEWIIRQTAVEALAEAGFVVIEAEHGADALASITKNPASVHALFTDVRMPGPINGFELARRAHALVPNIAILVASGHAVPGVDELPPGSRLLSKPYSLRELPKHLQTLLVERQAKNLVHLDL